jgi:hypothetical protein
MKVAYPDPSTLALGAAVVGLLMVTALGHSQLQMYELWSHHNLSISLERRGGCHICVEEHEQCT